ncbi:MAG TPA: M14 family zinc carboxypeptidase [Blastocatellia bacterium]|nr:M14 family zinc carboxypeptidase [Blastocatellia bacterium]
MYIYSDSSKRVQSGLQEPRVTLRPYNDHLVPVGGLEQQRRSLFLPSALAGLADSENLDEVIKNLRQTLPKCSLLDFLRHVAPKEVCTFDLGKTRQGRDIAAFFFPGTTERRAIVIAGVHGSELSGIEVAQLVIKTLFEESKKGTKPHFNVIVVPEVFPDNSNDARTAAKKPGADANDPGRFTPAALCAKRLDCGGKLVCVDPNRQFPTPGRPADFRNPVDSMGTEIEPENVAILGLIHGFGPSRVASVHAHKMPGTMSRNQDAPGIFADPHTVPASAAGTAPANIQAEIQDAQNRTKEDCELALKMATNFIAEYRKLKGKTTGGTDRVPGNWPDSKGKPTVCEYGSKAAHQCGISLGGWGPRAIRGGRNGITVITIEVRHYYPSNAKGGRGGKETSDGLANRLNELKAYAAAIKDSFLGPP